MADYYDTRSPSPTTTRSRRGGNRRRSRAPYSDSSEALLPDQLQELSFLVQQLNDLASPDHGGEGDAGALLPQPGPLNQLAPPQQGGGGKKDESLKLRLDLNLDVEVTIKAKVHGDVTLSLLG